MSWRGRHDDDAYALIERTDALFAEDARQALSDATVFRERRCRGALDLQSGLDRAQRMRGDVCDNSCNAATD